MSYFYLAVLFAYGVSFLLVLDLDLGPGLFDTDFVFELVPRFLYFCFMTGAGGLVYDGSNFIVPRLISNSDCDAGGRSTASISGGEL